MRMKEIDIDAFVRKFAGVPAAPAPRRKLAAQIMKPPQPLGLGPRLDLAYQGGRRWLTSTDERPSLSQYGYHRHLSQY